MNFQEGITSGDYLDKKTIALPDDEYIVREVKISVTGADKVDDIPTKFVIIVKPEAWLYEEENLMPPDTSTRTLHMMQVHHVDGEGQIFAANSWGQKVKSIPVPPEEITSMWKVSSHVAY